MRGGMVLFSPSTLSDCDCSPEFHLHRCDFYLVDVRDCQLDPEQRELMASCGAILEWGVSSAAAVELFFVL